MTEKENMIRLIVEKLEGQTDFVKKSVEWLVMHIALAKMFYEHSTPLSDKELKSEISRAIKSQDYAYYALIMYQKVMQGQQKPEHH